MRHLFCIPAIILLALSTIGAQSRGTQGKRQYVVVPPEQQLVSIAVQPDSPIQFEDVKIIRFLDGGGEPTLNLRNRSTKPIRSVTAAWWTVDAAGSTITWPRRVTNELVMPGQLVPSEETGELIEEVPLTDKLRDKLGLRGPLQGIAVLMVVKVTFADGSTYDAEPQFKALQAYCAKLAGFDSASAKKLRLD